MQFGYLSLFSCVFPLTAVLLLLNNVTEIRTDAYKICKLFRKPFFPPVADMGVWQVSGGATRTHIAPPRPPLTTSCVSDRLRGPELRLRCVQLLAAGAVAPFTEEVSGGRDEQHQPSAGGRYGGGKTTPRVPTAAPLQVPSALTSCVFAALTHISQGDSGRSDPGRARLDPKEEGAHGVHVYAGSETPGSPDSVHLFPHFCLLFPSLTYFLFFVYPEAANRRVLASFQGGALRLRLRSPGF